MPYREENPMKALDVVRQALQDRTDRLRARELAVVARSTVAEAMRVLPDGDGLHEELNHAYLALDRMVADLSENLL